MKRALAREKRARQDAEALLEKKSLELWYKNQELDRVNAVLSQKVLDGRQEIESLSRFPGENPHPVFRTNLKGEVVFSNQPFRKLFEEYPHEVTEFIHVSTSDIQGGESKSLDFSFGEKTFNAVIIQVLRRDYINYYFADITPLRKATDVIRFNEEKYRGVIESIELGLLELDHRLAVTKVYPKVLEMTGYSERDLLGEKVRDLLVDPDDFDIEEYRNGVVETRTKHAEGRDLWVRISTAPLRNPEGENIGYIAVVQDVSESHLRYEELKDAQLQAEESGKAKERFLANMSHELRTPMNAISGMAELLNENVHTEKEQKYIQTIIKATNNLLVVLDDVLHLSKIEAGQLEIEIRDISLFELFDHVKTTMSMKTLEKGLSFSVDLDPRIREFVKSDSVRLGQVLLNLVSNAIKFTKKGFVTVKIHLLKSDADSQSLRFLVQDSGIGIKEGNLEKIFQAFAQADNSIERKFGGTGLGLAISKQIIESLGGEITVESIPEVGTSFSFDLDFQLGENLLGAADDVKIDESKMDGLDVILAEDNDFNGLLVEELLAPFDLKLRWAKNGLEVLKMVDESVPDLILMDIQMPEMGGEECTVQLRKKYAKSKLKIIALTANVFRKDISTYYEIGMNGYLSKPFKKNELFRCMLTDNLSDEISEETESPDASFVFSLDELSEMVGGRESKSFKRMLEVFIEHTPGSLEQLEDASKKMDKKLIKSIAHKLKSSFRLFKVEPSSSLLSEIEENIEEKTTSQINSDVRLILNDGKRLLAELVFLSK